MKRVKQSRARRSQTRSRPARHSAEVAKGLQAQTRPERDGFKVRPSWHRYLHVYLALLEEGGSPTEAAVARALGISRMSLWRIHKRNPGLRPWVHEQCRERNAHLIGPVINMLGTMAIRTKSPRHAELFLRATGSLGPSGPELPGPPTAGDVAQNGPIINLLVPLPSLPGSAQAAPAVQAAPTVLPRSAPLLPHIPVVPVPIPEPVGTHAAGFPHGAAALPPSSSLADIPTVKVR